MMDMRQLDVSTVARSAMSRMEEKHRSANVKLYTLAFLAFLANSKSWQPYRMRHQDKVEEQALYEDSELASSSISTKYPAGWQQNASEVLSKKLPGFLGELTSNFSLDGKGGKDIISALPWRHGGR